MTIAVFEYTVVIPMFNARTTVTEALHSVQRQTIRPTEVIVVDDGSTDDSLEVVATAAELILVPIRVLSTKGRVGAPGARMVGIRAAKSPWVALLDADDYWDREKTAIQAAIVDADPSIDLVGCFFTEVYGDSLGSLRQEPFWQSAVMIRRSVCVAIPFKEDWRVADFPEFFSRFDEQYRRTFSPRPLLFYRVNESGLAHRRFLEERRAWLLVSANRERRARGLAEVPYSGLDQWFADSFSIRNRRRMEREWRASQKFRSAAISFNEGRVLLSCASVLLVAIQHPSVARRQAKRAWSVLHARLRKRP